MDNIILSGLLALGGVGVFMLHASKPARKDPSDPIDCLSRDRLLTEWERRSLQIIKRQLRTGYHVCPQVRLADLVQVSAPDRKTYFQAATQVQRKSIDFVVVSEETGEAAFAIELDDKTHDRPDRRRRDICVNAVFKQIGIPLLRYRPNMSISIPREYSRADF
ncbi:DUF2726 domain-containing protein [Acetobacter sp. UBA5411]|uniref:DUF2726 domain-containing protein n=1 Tax=Acetobacter sp. UBA5411 TaxID=1945905 RepID=UPI0025C10E82|nr:DUF2726 domain-containing protein [Acetobacter sp. UBA5411]